MSDRPADERPMQDSRPPAEAVCRIATICNQRGLHARAAARFVKTAGLFNAEVWVRKNGTEVSGRSIMGLMMLAAGIGSEIELTCSGRQAIEAMAALSALVEGKFGEE